jgi:predicted DNA-binding protein
VSKPSGGNYPRVVGVRLTEEDLQKLDQLALRTFRGRADILRCSIHQAHASPQSDLVLVSINQGEGSV